MRHPSAPNNNGQPQRTRARGAIRTHLGRKRTGPRTRGGNDMVRMHQRGEEDLFDRLRSQLQGALDAASAKTAAAVDAALDAACDTLVAAGEFTAENAERLRGFVRRDVLHRNEPTLTFRAGDITSSGTLTCENCGWTLRTTRTTLLSPCPRCSEINFRKTD